MKHKIMSFFSMLLLWLACLAIIFLCYQLVDLTIFKHNEKINVVTMLLNIALIISTDHVKRQIMSLSQVKSKEN